MVSKTVTRNDLKAVLDEVLPNASVDYIVEQGTSGIWTYRKWESGIVECRGTAELASKAVTSVFGSGYYASMDTIALPTGLFTAIDCVHTTLKDGNGNGSWFNLRAWNNTTIVGYIYSLKSHTATFKVSISVVGRWK